MKTKVLFLVNNTELGPCAIRARYLLEHFSRVEYKIVYRKNKLSGIFVFLLYAAQRRFRCIYVINTAFAGVIAALAGKFLFCKKFIIDTGDFNYQLFKSLGKNPLACFLMKILEQVTLKSADKIVTRSQYFKQYLNRKGYKKVYYIADGVNVSKFRSIKVEKLKNKIAPNNELIIGVVGTLTWAKKIKTCYGAELVEALNLMKEDPVKGLIVGSGNGKQYLEKKIREYGIGHKVTFTGWVEYEKLPEYINAMDVCLCTQTNDLVGKVRTTGKLPLYLACNKYVLATGVGDAYDILPDNMKLSYDGKKDLGYSKRLAGAVKDILNNKAILTKDVKTRDIALRFFDSKILSGKLEKLLEDFL